MIITPLGHSCFKLEESTGTTVICDPYSNEVGFAMPKCVADIVTVSHEHKDHSNISAVGGNPVIIKEVGSFEIKGVHISSFISYHDEVKGKKRGKNLVFNFRMDGVNICHMGDIGQQPNPFLIEDIGTVDVLIIPVGGKYSINAETAKEYVDKLLPAVVIPMHYKTENVVYNLDRVDDFLDLFDKNEIQYTNKAQLEFNRADFDKEFSTKVICFNN